MPSGFVSLVPGGSAGIGQGTEDSVYEVFTSSDYDLDDTTLMFCANLGEDLDLDGWTTDCGDEDDSDASVHP